MQPTFRKDPRPEKETQRDTLQKRLHYNFHITLTCTQGGCVTFQATNEPMNKSGCRNATVCSIEKCTNEQMSKSGHKNATQSAPLKNLQNVMLKNIVPKSFKLQDMTRS